MSSKVLPPKFIDDASGYPEYKKKLLRWTRITKIEPQKQAETVLHYLEGHSSGIQEKIDTALGDEVEDKPDGMTKMIAYMDTIYAEDEMTTAWTKYKEFIRLKKDVNQSVIEFIAEFDKKHKKAKETGCEFSDIVLGFNLLESCDLSETDEKFVLTAVNFKTGKQNNNLLEQIKNSLRKFQSRERLSGYKDDKIKVKNEDDSFVTEIKDALVADGWSPPSASTNLVKQNSPYYRGKKNPLGFDGKPLKCFKCQSEYHMADACDQNQKKKSNSQPKEGSAVAKDSKKGSVVAKDSKKGILKTSALSKLLAKDQVEGTALSKVLAKASVTEFGMFCQVLNGHTNYDSDGTDQKELISDSPNVENDPENELVLSKVLAKASATENGMVCQGLHGHTNNDSDVTDQKELISDSPSVENDPENELVLVSHDENELCLLIEEAGCRGVLDSGCSRSVAGLAWIRNYTELVSPTYSDELKLLPSSKIYQFGGGEKRNSKGQLTLPVVIGNTKIKLTIEVVDAPIPLLIGSNSMEKAKAVLNFGDSTAIFFNEVIDMIKVGVGHFCIDVFSKHVDTHK